MNTGNNLPEELAFPKTLNKKTWKKYLGRYLTKKENHIINEFSSDQNLNHYIDKLNKLCIEKNMYIASLTEVSGNCMFESLNYHSIGENIKSLRQGLAWIMYIFKDYKYFIPGDETTLSEKFIISNCGNEGTEFVVCKNKDEIKFYKYTYETMCQDITNYGSWSKLEPHILLSVISVLYHVEFIILAVSQNGSGVHTINAFENLQNPPELRKIYLGNIDNYHYFPIDILKTDDNHIVKYYTEGRDAFMKWAKTIEKIKIRNYQSYKNESEDSKQDSDKKIKIDTSDLSSVNIDINKK